MIWTCYYATAAAQTPETAPTAVPTYRFQGGYLNDWLVLGPVDKGTEFSDPIESLGEVRAGQEVTFPDGQKRTWTPISADGRGVVSLLDFVRQAAAAGVVVKRPNLPIANDRVIYAYCELEEVSSQPRQIMLGMTDSVRVWLDNKQIVSDQSTGWLSYYKHTLPVEFSETRRRGLLLELYNHAGAFEFACYGGRSVEGKAVFLDGITPAREVRLTVSVPGEAAQTVRTDASGRFTITAVPFGAAPTIRCLATTIQPTLVEKQQGSNAVELEPISITVSPTLEGEITKSKLPTPAGRYVAIAEQANGHLLLANDTDKTIYCYNGLRCYKHPDVQLHAFTHSRISDMRISQTGELWIATEDDGLFRLSQSVLKHWPVELTGARFTAMHAARNGDFLVGFGMSSFQNQNRFFRIAKGGDALETLDFPRKVSSVRAIFEEPLTAEGIPSQATRTLVAYAHGDIYLLDDLVTPFIQLPPDAKLNSMTRAGDGKLWCAGRSIFSLDKAGTWTEIPWWSGTAAYQDGFVGETQDGTLWAVAGTRIFIVDGETIIGKDIPAEIRAQRACISQPGSLFVTAGTAGVLEFKRSQLRKFDHRDGLASTYGLRVSATPQGVILCSDINQPVWAANQQMNLIDVSGLKHSASESTSNEIFNHRVSLVGLSGRRLLAFPMLESRVNIQNNFSSVMPRLKSPEEDWQELQCATWTDTFARYLFCTELADGRVLIGTSKGILELEGNQLVPSDVLKSLPGQIPDPLAAMQAADKSLWIALCDGQLVNLQNGMPRVFHLPFQSECGATALAEFNGKLWVGNLDGLFCLTPQSGQFCAVDDPSLTAHSIVGLETSIVDGQMWIVTRSGSVLAMREDETTTHVPIFEPGQSPMINDSAAGPDGRLWLATQEGIVAYRPSKIAPLLFVDKVDGERHHDRDLVGPLRVECDRAVDIELAWQDDSHRLPIVQVRINSGPWRIANPESNSNLVGLRFDTLGTQVVNLQCYDGESNYSNLVTLEFETFYPFWRDPRMRTAAVCIAVLGLAVISHLTWLNYRTRQERNQIRENLLAEESRARQNAEEASREREMLLGRVCHDLRNPLGVVGMVSDLLKTAQADRETAVELLDGSAQSMNYLTEQLLTYVQSRSGANQPAETPVVLRDYLHNFEVTGKFRLQKSEVELTTRVDPSLPVVVVMDPDMMTEVLNNLFENAVRHTPTGSIALECHSTPDSRLQFTLTDSGSGMCQETLATIFQPFYRGESRPIHHNPGVGLGMFVVHELVNCMHGQIGISSQLGVGTTVRITLPLVTAPIDEPQPSDSKFDSQPIA